MMVAAVAPLGCGSFSPSVRASKPETISGCRIGAVTSSPRKPRIHAIPSPRTVEHAQRERPLLTGHLVVIQLHRVDLAAAVLIVLRVGSEHRAQQDARARAFGVRCHGFSALEPRI